MIETDQHTFICGITGSGKTTYAVWDYKNIGGLAVFYNTQLELKVEDASTAIVNNLNGFTRAYNKGHRKICYNPDEDEDIALKDLEELIKLLFNMGKQVQKGIKDYPIKWCYLYIDEVHEYSSKVKPNKIVDRVWKRGRRWGIVGRGISQRPAEVSHTILTQSSQHVIFFLGQYEKGYFDRYKIPIAEGEYREWISQGWTGEKRKEDRYHFVVYDQVDLYKHYPVEI